MTYAYRRERITQIFATNLNAIRSRYKNAAVKKSEEAI